MAQNRPKQPVDNTYGVTSRDYLARARRQLNTRRADALFYAALELRSGIESRLQEYVEASAFVTKQRIHGWQIAKVAKGLERAFKLGDKIVQLTIRDRQRRRPSITLYHTPVSARLRGMGERLGDMLHALKKFRSPSDPWWSDSRAYLEDVYEQLRLATIGTLLSPMLLNRATGQATVVSEVPGSADPEAVMRAFVSHGDDLLITVKYRDRLPRAVARAT